MDRKDYWNKNYLNYWKSKVEEANETASQAVTPGDCKTSSDALAYQLFSKVEYHPEEKMLDFGCGFGRFCDFFLSRRQDYYGIDISSAMIQEAKKNHAAIEDHFFVAEGEHLPFQDESFATVICYGVFDACYQEDALSEMIRVVRPGGVIVLSGKNNRYFEDDELAIVAEKNARLKGHPNYFTDGKKMKSQLEAAGVEVLEEGYFLRRKDMEVGACVGNMPDRFYAWQFILRKSENAVRHNFEKFSDCYSATWKELEQSGEIH